MKKVILFICLFPLLTSVVHATSNGTNSYNIEVDLTDTKSLQRGARIFINYCLSCHSASYMRYNRLGKDLGISEQTLKENFMFGTDKSGETMKIAMKPSESKVFFGVSPPDLSVIARARGADWLYSYFLSFYSDPSRPFGVNNLQFKDTAMPHVLWELQGFQRPVYNTVTRGDGSSVKVIEGLETGSPGKLSPQEYEETVYDLVNFLVYLSEPVKLKREKIGIWVIIYLLVLLPVAYKLKKEYWRDVK